MMSSELSAAADEIDEPSDRHLCRVETNDTPPHPSAPAFELDRGAPEAIDHRLRVRIDTSRTCTPSPNLASLIWPGESSSCFHSS